MLEGCHNPSCDTPLGADEMLANERMAPRIASEDDPRWRSGQLPSRRLVSARRTLEKYALRFELHQVIVPVQRAIELAQPRQRPRDDAIDQLMRVTCGIECLVERDGVAALSRHVFGSFSASCKNAFVRTFL
jgi:hypothetical protein